MKHLLFFLFTVILFSCGRIAQTPSATADSSKFECNIIAPVDEAATAAGFKLVGRIWLNRSDFKSASQNIPLELVQGVTYLIRVQSNRGSIIAVLLDGKERELRTNLFQGNAAAGWAYQCTKTGRYTLHVTFDHLDATCGVVMLSQKTPK